MKGLPVKFNAVFIIALKTSTLINQSFREDFSKVLHGFL